MCTLQIFSYTKKVAPVGRVIVHLFASTIPRRYVFNNTVVKSVSQSVGGFKTESKINISKVDGNRLLLSSKQHYSVQSSSLMGLVRWKNFEIVSPPSGCGEIVRSTLPRAHAIRCAARAPMDGVERHLELHTSRYSVNSVFISGDPVSNLECT